MNSTVIRWHACSLFVALLPLAAFGQLAVDATVPIRERLRSATTGTSGSIGRKLAIQVAIETTRTSPNDSGMTELDFILTNTGKTVLTLPISPHPRDLEPTDPKTDYTVEVLRLYVTSDKRQGLALSKTTDLYGSRMSPETLVKLAPGESIRVLTILVLPRDPHTSEAGETFVAHAVLDSETIRNINGQTVSNTQELGSASSIEYASRSLYKRSD